MTAPPAARDAALAPYLQTLGEHRSRIVGSAGGVFVVGVHPQLASRTVADRSRLPPVVGVCMCADEEPHVLQAQVDHVQRSLELTHRAGLVHAGIDQDDARAGGDRPGIAVWYPWPGQRKAQAPEPRQHALTAT